MDERITNLERRQAELEGRQSTVEREHRTLTTEVEGVKAHQKTQDAGISEAKGAAAQAMTAATGVHTALIAHVDNRIGDISSHLRRQDDKIDRVHDIEVARASRETEREQSHVARRKNRERALKLAGFFLGLPGGIVALATSSHAIGAWLRSALLHLLHAQ